MTTFGLRVWSYILIIRKKYVLIPTVCQGVKEKKKKKKKKKNILSCSSFQPLAPPPGMDPGVGCHVIKAKLTVHQWPKYECFLIYSYQDMN